MIKNQLRKVAQAITLHRMANVAVLFSVFIAVGIFFYNYTMRLSRPLVEPGLVKGNLFPLHSGYEAYRRTLVLVLNTDCLHCQSSLPFYTRLNAAGQDSKNELHVLALFPNDRVSVQRFLNENHLQIDTLPNIELKQLKIAGTPSLILLNSKGEVIDFWIGKLSSEQEQDVLNALL